MIDAFLSLKYQGVKTPWEMLKDNNRFGWQCRKYLKWKEVFVKHDDREKLKLLADSLIDTNEVNLSCLPAANRVLERVQRWRKDKEGFSEEPDERQYYSFLRREIDLAKNDSSQVFGLLSRLGLNEDYLVNKQDLDQISFFLSAEILNYLHEFKGSEFAIVELKKTSCHELVDLAISTVNKLYKSYGLKPGSLKSPSLCLKQFLNDIGILTDGLPDKLNSVSFIDAIPSKIPNIIIEWKELSKEVFLRTDFRQGVLYLICNSAHPWVKVHRIDSPIVQDLIISLGESIYGMLGDKEVLDNFLTMFGLGLLKRAG
jgi:hypothetical protein